MVTEGCKSAQAQTDEEVYLCSRSGLARSEKGDANHHCWSSDGVAEMAKRTITRQTEPPEDYEVQTGRALMNRDSAWPAYTKRGPFAHVFRLVATLFCRLPSCHCTYYGVMRLRGGRL